ncbi:MAG: autotransporter domain-containing protein [Halioglobus sp.]|nr:autotransporter domain-containing protein [Halioglobus sp.]
MRKPVQNPALEKTSLASTPFQRLALHSAVVAALVGGGYGRGAYAGSCTSGPVSVCSGAANDGVDVTQNLAGTSLTVSTTPGFGLDTTSTGGYALNLRASNGLSFTDANDSGIVGAIGGIDAQNSGSGELRITTSGEVNVAEERRTGIHARNYGTDLALQVETITGALESIHAKNFGSGALSITSSGTIESPGFTRAAIYASNWGTDLTVQTAEVDSRSVYAIEAWNNGSGALSISSTGSLRGGIYAFAHSGTGLTIQTAAVGGRIRAINGSSGAMDITIGGKVQGADAVESVFVGTGITATDLSLKTEEVEGGFRPIVASNFGVGALSITTSGAVTSIDSTNAGTGITARNRGTDLILNTADVTAGKRAIYAKNYGSGALIITSSGALTGTNDSGKDGVYARNYGTDMTLQVAAVRGGGKGIWATNEGSGALSLRSTGDVAGHSEVGIYAFNSGTDMSLNTATVTGGKLGISARNSGSGALSITSEGVVTGTTGHGIYASNLDVGTDLMIQTAGVTSGYTAISARNHGNGSLSVTSNAPVAGLRGGISALNFGAGAGALSVTSTAAVTGADYFGISAGNRGTDTTIQAASVSGTLGIFAYNSNGTLSITSSGTVTGTENAGILANNYGLDLALQAAEVTGGLRGIAVYNKGSGALSVVASGVVTTINDSGIVANHYGTQLSLQTAAVTGADHGIDILHNGEGTLSITTDGVVTGNSGQALRLDRSVAGTTDGAITNNGGLISNQSTGVVMTRGLNFIGEFNNHADITGGNGTAFDASASRFGFALNQASGAITGDVLLGSGDDRVTITGGSINGKIIGQGFGVVTIDVGAGNAFNSNGVIDVADYVIQSGIVQQVADFSTAATTTTVASGATLSFNSVIHGGGALVSSGDLTFVLTPDAAGELIQAGTVTFNAGSTVTLDTSGFTAQLNESLQLITATGIIDNGVTVNADIPESFLYDYETLINSSSVSVETTVADLGAVSPLQNPSAFGDSMTAFVSGGGDNAVVDLLAGLESGDVTGFEQIADVFSPSVSGAVSQGAREANDSTWRLINERFVGSDAALHVCEPPNGVWLQGYGGIADQDGFNGVDGFDADTSGVAVGYDLDLDQWRVGAAFSAGETDIDNDRFASDSIDIESNQFIVYGGFRQEQWFANATASAASLDYDFKRNNMIAGEGQIKSDTDGDLLGVSVRGGYQYTVAENLVLTPQLSLRYTTLDVDDYSEDGGLDLRVEYDSIDTLASELGVSASARFTAGAWQWSPTARLAWVHEYLGENERATARYADQSYVQEGFDPDENFASVGLGVAASNAHGVSVGIDYRGAFGSHYTSNQGWLNVRYEF